MSALKGKCFPIVDTDLENVCNSLKIHSGNARHFAFVTCLPNISSNSNKESERVEARRILKLHMLTLE